MEVTTAGSSYLPDSQCPKEMIKTWKLGQGAQRGKSPMSEQGAGRLVSCLLKGTRKLGLQGCWKNCKLCSAFATGRNSWSPSEGSFPGMLTTQAAGRSKSLPCPPAWQPPSGSPWWAESQPQHHKAGGEG